MEQVAIESSSQFTLEYLQPNWNPQHWTDYFGKHSFLSDEIFKCSHQESRRADPRCFPLSFSPSLVSREQSDGSLEESLKHLKHFRKRDCSWCFYRDVEETAVLKEAICFNGSSFKWNLRCSCPPRTSLLFFLSFFFPPSQTASDSVLSESLSHHIKYLSCCRLVDPVCCF